MDNIQVWNVRGLNSLNKQKEVKASLIMNKVGFCGLVETKIKPDKGQMLCHNMFQGWCVCSNIASLRISSK